MLSEIDKRKEKYEEDCLNKAIQLAMSKRAMTRNIMKMLSGQTIKRERNDRPDIIRLYRSDNPAESDTYIGIEHFMIDQIVEISGKKQGSLRAKHLAYINKIHNHEIAILSNDQGVPEKTYYKLIDSILELATVVNKSGYKELLVSLKQNLSHHHQKVKEYRGAISSVAGNYPIKLALLLEIQSYFPTVFLNNGRNVIHNSDGLMPMFREVVDELEKVDCSLVDYIILYIKNASNENVSNVIAVNAGQVVQDLRRQSIPIYEYFEPNYELRVKDYQIVKSENERYHISNLVFRGNNLKIEDYFSALRKAYIVRRQGKPFATTRDIQMMLYAYSKKIDFSTGSDKQILRQMNSVNYKEVLKLFVEFENKYPIK